MFFIVQKKFSYDNNVNGEVSLKLQHIMNNSNSFKSGCDPELLGIIEQGVCRHIYSPLEAINIGIIT